MHWVTCSLCISLDYGREPSRQARSSRAVPRNFLHVSYNIPRLRLSLSAEYPASGLLTCWLRNALLAVVNWCSLTLNMGFLGCHMILLFALLASTQSIASGDYPPDAACQDHGDGSTMAMSECLMSQSDIWERRLQLEYRAAIARAEVDVDKLKRAQGAWLRYRDTNCEAYNSVKGSIRAILTGTCWRDMTRDRTLELKEMGWAG